MKRYLHQVQEHYLVFKQQNSEFVISSWKTFFCKYFADLAKTHKQRLQRAFKTTYSNKKEIVNVRATKLLRKMQVKVKNESQYQFITCLIEDQVMKLLKCDREIDAKTALKLELESRSLPVEPQLRFNRNGNKPRFIKCSYTRVHFNFSFDNSLRMTYLMNALPKGQ